MASIATLHHLPLAPMLRKMGRVLRPGGMLLVIDLYKAQNAADFLVGALGFPASRVIGLARKGARSGPHQPPEARRAWEEHYDTDVFPTLADVREACAEAGLQASGTAKRALRKPPAWTGR